MPRKPRTLPHPSTLVEIAPDDELMFKERYKAIKIMVHELEDENNLVAYKVAQTRARIEALKAIAAQKAAQAEAQAEPQLRRDTRTTTDTPPNTPPKANGSSFAYNEGQRRPTPPHNREVQHSHEVQLPHTSLPAVLQDNEEGDHSGRSRDVKAEVVLDERRVRRDEKEEDELMDEPEGEEAEDDEMDDY